MANKLRNADEVDKQHLARRVFFAWVGQVAAGASLAGIGLGFVNPATALADSKASRLADTSLRPDCNPCPSPGTFCCRSCVTDSNCQPGGHLALTYDFNGGCVIPPQQCPTYVACSRCVSSCPTNC